MNTRDLGMSNGAGKGDADRSPGWREHYDEINWGETVAGSGLRRETEGGFIHKGGRLVKRYGPAAAKKIDDVEEHEFRMGL